MTFQLAVCAEMAFTDLQGNNPKKGPRTIETRNLEIDSGKGGPEKL